MITCAKEFPDGGNTIMTACGFIENNDAVAIFRGYISEDDEVFVPVKVKEYYLTKEQYMKGQR